MNQRCALKEPKTKERALRFAAMHEVYAEQHPEVPWMRGQRLAAPACSTRAGRRKESWTR